MSYHKITQIETGCDWLTTTTTGDGARRAAYQSIYLAFAGQQQKPFSWRGFVGQQRSDGMLQYGHDASMDRTILIAKGKLADEVFQARPVVAHRISRIDLQTTICFDSPQSDFLQDIYSGKTRLVRSKTRVENSEGGETVYFGSRTSVLFVRIYDAGVRHKLGDKGLIFRYEIEVKKPRALALAQALWGCRERRGMRDYMLTWQAEILGQRGVEVPWDNPGVTLLSDNLTLVKKGENTTFTWLSTQVASAIEKLLKQGYTKEMISAVLFPKEVYKTQTKP